MTIRNLDRFLASLVDWAILDGCFPYGISPTDVDGMVEINGRVLFLEHKLPGAGISIGQGRAFDALGRRGDTVIVFKSAEPHDEIRQILIWDGSGVRRYDAASLDLLKAFVRQWAEGGVGPLILPNFYRPW